ncbi:hypothetical protein RKD33_004427 [Streptomyces sp. SAI-129]
MSVEQVQNIGGGEEGAAEQAGGAVAAAALSSYPVAPGYRLNVRSGPGTNYSVVRVLAEGSRVTINCQRTGERVSGPLRHLEHLGQHRRRPVRLGRVHPHRQRRLRGPPLLTL